MSSDAFIVPRVGAGVGLLERARDFERKYADHLGRLRVERLGAGEGGRAHPQMMPRAAVDSIRPLLSITMSPASSRRRAST